MERKWQVVVAMSGVMVLLTLDFFGLTVALPKIGEDLKASTTSLLWVINGYLLVFAAPIIAVGRLADIVGRRKIVLVGIVIFVGGSAACAAAPNDTFLIGARLVQGLGGSMIFATSLSTVSNAFPPDERAVAIGVWSGVGLVGSAIGPFVAGVLTQTASWRWFFFINVPIGVAVILLTLRSVEESRDETFHGRIDWTGFATITAGFVLLILGLQDSAQKGWTSPLILGSLAGAAVLLVTFFVTELRVPEPLVDVSLFRTTRYAGASVVACIGNWMFGSILFFLTLYLQEVLDLDPIEAGVVFLTFTIPLVLMSPVSGRMVSRYGAQQLMAVGMALIAGGLVAFAVIGAAGGLPLVIVGLVITGFGQGFAFNISNTAGMEAIDEQKAGVASGVLSSARLMGIVVGLAISGALFKVFENRALISKFAAAGGHLTASDKSEVRGLLSGSDAAIHKLSSLAPQLRHQIEGIVNQSFVHGLRGVMVLSIVLSALSVPPALWGRTRHVLGGEHPVAHPLWAGLWRRAHVPRPEP